MQRQMMRLTHLALLVLLSACRGSAPDPPAEAGGSTRSAVPAEAGDSAAAAPESADTLIRPAAPRYRYTVLDSATADVDGDGVAERVELAATVEVGDDGRPLWEDGHQWMVAVRDGDDTYPLVERFVPWGGAAFWIVEPDSAGPAAILVQSSAGFGGHGGTRLERFGFDRARGGYVRSGAVEAWGRTLYRGPPDMPGLLPPTRRPGSP